MTFGRTGRVLNVLLNWSADARGQARAVQTIASLTKVFGPPVYEGDDTHGNWVHHWSTDTLCVGFYDLRMMHYFQLSRSTPDFLGRAGCPR